MPVGFALGSSVLWASDAELARTMDMAAEAGAKMVRFDVSWTFAEPSPGEMNWQPTDRVVEAATRRRLEVLATVTNSPAWAAAGRIRHTGRPADPGQFAAFAGKAAQRYAGQVGQYEVWNEPNGRLFFQPDPDPAIYASMVRLTYQAIKQADSKAVVVAGALGATGHGEGVIVPVEYLKQMYAAGVAGSFDALSYHPYDYLAPLAGGALYPGSPTQQMVDMFDVMAANGDGDKPIWITEYGAPTSVVGERMQSTLIVDSVRQWPEVEAGGPFFIYGLRDIDSEIGDPHAGFGLVTADFTPKPAFRDLKAVLRAKNPARAQYEQFSVARDPTLGRSLTPIYTVAAALAQQFERGTRFMTAKGVFNSPPAVAALARAWKIVPIGPFNNGYQDFAVDNTGRIFSNEATGTHLVVGAILAAWTPSIGFPVSDQYDIGTASQPGAAVDFERGRITWQQNTGVKVVAR